MKPTEREFLVMAALLHDIGKFRQRTGLPLNTEDENLKSACLPLYNGNYSHYHVLHSGKFIREILGERWEDTENLVLYHHQPNALPHHPRSAKIIALADRLSSGERHGKEEGDKAGNPRKDPLISVFSKLLIDNKPSGKAAYFPLKRLQQDMEPCFPVDKPQEALPDTAYSEAWDAFLGECKKINFQTEEFDYIYSCLLTLMEKYTLFIPSATWQDEADLSLYHHSKSTAALALCLYDLNWDEILLEKVLSNINESDNPVAYLVGGDISGIQDFIYSVTSSKALKGLKGRSYYLQLLIEATARTILKEWNLPDSNIIFMGGGHFNLLIPAKDEVREIIQKISMDTNKILLSAHGGQLAIVLESIPVQAKGFVREKFLEYWNELAQSMAKKKKQKFAELFGIPSLAESLFSGESVTGLENRCSVCGKDNQSDENEQCPLCQSFSQLAKSLAEAKSLNWTPLPDGKLLSEKMDSWNSVLAKLGWNFKMKPTGPAKTDGSVNSTEFLPGKSMVFMGSHTPMGEEHSTKTLDELAASAQGISKWGILRADVDHLGKTFGTGLGEDRTLSRVSMLSYLMNLFFTLQLQALIKKSGYKDQVYIIYSGGDDLCILGSWSVLPPLANLIRDSFRKFTSERLSISAGIYLAPSEKYPIYQAADYAGEAVDTAKNKGRNRITFFEESLEWDYLKELELLQVKITKLLIEDRVPRSILSTLYYSRDERELVKTGRIPMERIWRVLYSLKRTAERCKKPINGDLPQRILSLREDFILGSKFKPQTEIAVRWADYLTRKD